MLEELRKIWDLCRTAQQVRAEKTEAKGEQRCWRPLEVGEIVFLKRPPLAGRDEEGEEAKISTKLRGKTRREAYKIIKTCGNSNYILGDVATGQECTFHQPIHADRLIVYGEADLDPPISHAQELMIEGNKAKVLGQAWDGRVNITFGTAGRTSSGGLLVRSGWLMCTGGDLINVPPRL